MKDITLIVMAAGDSVRFCSNSCNNETHHTFHTNKNYTNQVTTKTSINATSQYKHSTKKQWLRLGVTPLWHFVTNNLIFKILETLTILQNTNTKDNKENTNITLKQAIITASQKDIAYMRKLIENTLCFNICGKTFEIPLKIIEGGSTRFKSLKNAMQEVSSDYVIVSDCARFDTKLQVLKDMFSELTKNNYDCIVPYLNIADTTLYYDEILAIHKPINRENLKCIQTPQITNTKRLLESFSKHQDFSDESSAICSLDNPTICFVEGSKDMAKLTFHDDIGMLKKLYYSNSHLRQNDTLIGHGSDIHGFIDSKPMYLCGVKIQSNQGFKAHSDGDVAIHSIIDSILGAMNYGDIGELFPDTKQQFKDIDSKLLLQETYNYCLSTGLEIINLDITIIAQTPKISPYKTQMQETLAKLLYLPKMCISIKASTAEGLGFVGRKEGVLVQSVVQLRARKL